MTKQNMGKNIKKMSALLLNNTPNAVENNNFLNIELDKIITGEQPRKKFDEDKLQELADSISLYGVMTPITVSRHPEGSFMLMQGERRYRASLKAGLKTIPAVIDDEYKNNLVEKQLIENLQREDLTTQEIAESILYLIDIRGAKKTDVAKALSKSNAFISNYYAYATFEHELKETIFSRTQDLILIAEFKRLLKNASAEECRIINEFLLAHETFSRNDMEELKKFLREKDDIKQSPPTLPVSENDPFAKNISEPAFDWKETPSDEQPHADEVSLTNIKDDLIEENKDDNLKETSGNEPKYKEDNQKDVETLKKKQPTATVDDSGVEDYKMLVSLPKILNIIKNMVTDPIQAEAIINQIKNEVFKNAN